MRAEGVPEVTIGPLLVWRFDEDVVVIDNGDINVSGYRFDIVK